MSDERDTVPSQHCFDHKGLKQWIRENVKKRGLVLAVPAKPAVSVLNSAKRGAALASVGRGFRHADSISQNDRQSHACCLLHLERTVR
jgi:hypothetical protein